MLNKKSITITLSSTIIAFNSGIAAASEDSITSSLPPIWPLLALIIFVVVFRKQLNCTSATDQSEKTAAPKSKAKAPKVATSTPAKTNPVNDNSIDLKDGTEQCQASTAKGTRCKRKTNLEETRITIDNTAYQLTVCKQHNTKGLKPFSELLK